MIVDSRRHLLFSLRLRIAIPILAFQKLTRRQSFDKRITKPKAISRLVDSSTIVEAKWILMIPRSGPIASVLMTRNVLNAMSIMDLLIKIAFVIFVRKSDEPENG